MSKIANQLQEVVNQKNALATNLTRKGVSASSNETLNTLVPKVLAIPTGGGTSIFKNITADGDYYPIDDGVDNYSGVSVNVMDDYNALMKFSTLSGSNRFCDIKEYGNIPSYAWNGMTKIQNIELINCEEIEQYAFNSCSNAETITNNKPLTAIGQYAFNGCSKLTGTLVLDDSITALHPFTFTNSKLKFNLPSNLTTIEARACSGCTELEIDELPSSLNFIATYGMYNCRLLEADELPTPLTLSTYALGSTGIKISEIPSGVALNSYCMQYCNNITNLTFNNSGTIPIYCFRGCDGLQSITLNSGITAISGNVFYKCSNLKTVTINKTDAVITLGTNAFGGATLDTIYVPSSLLERYKTTTNWSRYADIMVGV